MFHQGMPVSAFDIAQLVQSTLKDRRRVKPKPKGSIIEALIEEALLEFTSLTDEQRDKAAGTEPTKDGSRSSNPGGAFVDPTNWEAEFSNAGQRDSSLPAARPSQLEAGNLSALEEEDQAGDLSPTDAPMHDTAEVAPVGVQESPPPTREELRASRGGRRRSHGVRRASARRGRRRRDDEGPERNPGHRHRSSDGRGCVRPGLVHAPHSH